MKLREISQGRIFAYGKNLEVQEKTLDNAEKNFEDEIPRTRR